MSTEAQRQANKRWYQRNAASEVAKKRLRNEGDWSLDPIYVASCSFGKDSLATILLALEHNEPLDRVAFCEVMYDHKRNISGELPTHIQWVNEVARPKLQSWGLQVDTIRANEDFLTLFSREIRSGHNKGLKMGFPMMGACYVESYCKTSTIRRYYRELRASRPLICYVGIAADETPRLVGINRSRTKISLLAKYGVTEAMAKDMCKANGLLSPIYDETIRTGCWFCPNRKLTAHAAFAKEHPCLWREFVELGKVPNRAGVTFNYNETIEQYDAKVQAINKQLTLF